MNDEKGIKAKAASLVEQLIKSPAAPLTESQLLESWSEKDIINGILGAAGSDQSKLCKGLERLSKGQLKKVYQGVAGTAEVDKDDIDAGEDGDKDDKGAKKDKPAAKKDDKPAEKKDKPADKPAEKKDDKGGKGGSTDHGTQIGKK